MERIGMYDFRKKVMKNNVECNKNACGMYTECNRKFIAKKVKGFRHEPMWVSKFGT